MRLARGTPKYTPCVEFARTLGLKIYLRSAIPPSQSRILDRVLINTHANRSDLVPNERMGYVAVSRPREECNHFLAFLVALTFSWVTLGSLRCETAPSLGEHTLTPDAENSNESVCTSIHQNLGEQYS